MIVLDQLKLAGGMDMSKPRDAYGSFPIIALAAKAVIIP
jgi:hypothetical protein